MARPDLNLLVLLQTLLQEGGVARAARRLRMSPSAVSHALARLRAVTGDPLFVRAGRGLVPTTRALQMREQVGAVVETAQAMLRPVRVADMSAVSRSVTLRASDGFVETFGAALLRRVAHEAPGISLRFLQKADHDESPLRDAWVDLEVGVVSRAAAPDMHIRALYRDRFVGAVHPRHALAQGKVTRAAYVAARHVLASRRPGDKEPVERALDRLGLSREIVATVGGFASALALARTTELVATVPERHTGALRHGLHTFALPLAVPPMTVSLSWHPRTNADAVHRWLRECIATTCRKGRDG